MWLIVPALVTAGAFYLAWKFCDGEPSRSEWGVFVVGFVNIALFVCAAFVSLVAWLVYFILN